jgi:hypothetical protein
MGAGYVDLPELKIEGIKKNRFSDLVGEVLDYRLGSLLFKRIADAEFFFGQDAGSGRFYAVLNVQARGFVGWITQHRRHTYKSEFEVVDGGKRLRPIYHKRVISYGEKKEIYEGRLDYNRMRYNWKITRNGRVAMDKSGDIPDGKVLEDVLSAFYNFRLGVFGKVEPGKNYRVDTIPGEKGVTHFNIKVATEGERKYLEVNGEKDFVSAYLLMVDIPPEIFDSRTGDGRIWLDKDMIPVAGVIKDVIGIGDIIGDLEEKSLRRSPVLEGVGGG